MQLLFVRLHRALLVCAVTVHMVPCWCVKLLCVRPHGVLLVCTVTVCQDSIRTKKKPAYEMENREVFFTTPSIKEEQQSPSVLLYL